MNNTEKILRSQLADTEAKLLEAHLIIDFYAYEDNWKTIKVEKSNKELPPTMENDKGKIAREYLEDGEGIAVDSIPCDIFLPPATVVYKGAPFRALLYAIGVREDWTKLKMWNESRWTVDREKALIILKKTEKHRKDNKNEND